MILKKKKSNSNLFILSNSISRYSPTSSKSKENNLAEKNPITSSQTTENVQLFDWNTQILFVTNAKTTVIIQLKMLLIKYAFSPITSPNA